ncbi:hypothetical protein [Anaerostipes hadrus]|uniref:Uncharacterized protein n=1 Tax=Anaerostipes hadrus TaxID=649756 RepID=A0ABX2I0Y4_ANAHA|nr:hypothetical protein [Anaerostipes hadrus]MCQ4783138.1 hypothetical protein [Anaerostipes hadrus]NSG80150.1 hypothetical protein [Anaerostipes hadrus]NSH09536.1 hypothetical protein [Anaerostipes hadrus]NSH27260.1 hypothetical protein [Anaerostipes hadrus]NSH47249.1 hypothetical protein [Anaerostipes hadrus]
MFSSGYKKQALKECEKAGETYKKEYDNTIKNSSKLYSNKQEARKILEGVEEYVNLLANKPKEFEKTIKEVSIRRKAFEKEVRQLEIEAKEADKVGKGIVGGGLLAGAGVAAFGPTAAMGIATTFGTASTGTAIATLAGAAQTNAALAWLGGGALAAGGTGVAGGEAFLAMAGPVGWAIGGFALVGGGLLANSKNKKIAEKAEAQTKKIKAETTEINKIKERIIAEIKVVEQLNAGISNTLVYLMNSKKMDYWTFTDDERDALAELINASESLSVRLGVKIS